MNDLELARRRRHRSERILAALIVLAAIIGSLLLFDLNRRDAELLRTETTYVPKPFVITDDTRLLAEYVRIDTSNPPGGETAGARWLIAQLAAAGIKAELIESQPGRGNVYARIRGKRRGAGLLLLNHIDVVPADPKGWTRPPFAGETFLDAMYGRGTVDMKGTAICQLRAFVEVAKSGRVPEHDLVFLAVADEEQGGTWGTRWLLANRPDLFEGIRYALNEGGITEIVAEKMTYFGIEIGTKLIVTATLHAPTREQLQKARIALEPMYGSRKVMRVMPEVRRFFRELAPQRLLYRRELEDIDRAVSEGTVWRLPKGYLELMQDVVIADAVRRDGNRFVMSVRMINLPDTRPADRIAAITSAVRPYGVGVVVTRSEGPITLSPIDTPLYRLIAREAVASWPATSTGTEILNGSYNDSRLLRQRGIVAYGLQVFPIDFFQSEAIHGVDERVRVASFQEGVALMSRVVGQYAFGAE